MSEPKKIKNNFFKYLIALLLTILIVVVVLSSFAAFMLQKPSTQKFLVAQATHFLSKKLHTTINIEGAHVDIFSKIVLENVFIEDWNCDTLLYAKSLRIGINKLALWHKTISIEGIELNDPYFNIYRTQDSEHYNFQFIIDEFKSPNPQPKDSLQQFDWQLALNSLCIQNARFALNDVQTRLKLNVLLAYWQSDIEQLDIAQKTIKLGNIVLDKPNVSVLINKHGNNTQHFSSGSEYDFDLYVPFTPPNWHISSPNISLNNLQINYKLSNASPLQKDIINFKNLGVRNATIVLKEVDVFNDVVTGQIVRGNLEEQSGFKVKKVQAHIHFTGTKLAFTQLNLVTEHSNIGNQISLSYKSLRNFYDFINRVHIDANIQKSHITLKDLAYFAAPLHQVALLKDNLNKNIFIAGNINGEIKKIKTKNLSLKLNETYLLGDIKMQGLPDFRNTNIDAKINTLQTNMNDVRNTLQGIKIPPSFDKLGQLNFKGRFTGFPTQFAAEGDLQTNIGQITTDLNMNLEALPTYNGYLAVNNFELGQWLNQTDNIGSVSLEAQIDGKGLKQKDLDMLIDGHITHIELKKYGYNNVSLKGHIQNKKFTGNLVSNDTNANFNFEGKVDFSDAEKPYYNFTANVRNVNFSALNLISNNTKGDLKVLGKTNINLYGTEIDNIIGDAEFYGLTIRQGDKVFHFNDLSLSSTYDKHEKRTLAVTSDVADINIEGNYTFKDLPNAFQNYLHAYFPHRFKAAPSVPSQDFYFKIALKNPTSITQVILPQLSELNKGMVKGWINASSKQMELTADIPSFLFDGNEVKELVLSASSNKERIVFDTEIDEIIIQNIKQKIPQIKLKGDIQNDNINFNFTVDNDTAANYLQLDGLIHTDVKALELDLFRTEIVVNNKKWEANTGSFVYKNKDYFVIDTISLQQEEQTILIHSKPSADHKNHSEISLQNINLSDFNYITAIKNLGIETIVDAKIVLKDLFESQIINANIKGNDLIFRGQTIGDVKVNAEKTKEDKFIALKGRVNNDRYIIDAIGKYQFPTSRLKGDQGSLDNLAVHIEKGDLAFLEAFLGALISNTKGVAKGDILFDGNLRHPRMYGKLFLSDGQTKIDYLQTVYSLKNQKVLFEGNNIRFYNFSITDQNNKPLSIKKGSSKPNSASAKVNGNIFLNEYHNMSLDVQVKADNPFLFMNTTEKDNAYFYGTAYGTGLINIYGPVSKIAMEITATSSPHTYIYLPISYETEVAEEDSFYSFMTTNKQATTTNITLPKNDINYSGFDIQFDLDITPDAEIQIIFDMQTDDIIKARGKGDIQIHINTIRDYQFDVYGYYSITDGNYLFNLPDYFVKKPFNIERGSTLTFAGDVYEARLDVNAIYNVKTARYDLLSGAEQMGLSHDEEQELRRRVPIDVYLKMTRTLSQPKIDFDIKQVGQSSSRVDEMVDKKLKDMVRNKSNELNKQVFGLLVVNSFMPPEQLDFNITEGVNTTVSELLSSYLSSYLNEVLAGIIPDSELNVNWRNYSTDYYDEAQQSEDAVNRNEIELMFTKRLLDDRLSINLGGNLDVGDEVGYSDEKVAIAGDFIVQYRITPDGKYQVTAFNKYDNDIFSGDYNKVGASIHVTQEFDTFKELFTRRASNAKGRADKKAANKAKKSRKNK